MSKEDRQELAVKLFKGNDLVFQAHMDAINTLFGKSKAI
jgi:hypothetical protein